MQTKLIEDIQTILTIEYNYSLGPKVISDVIAVYQKVSGSQPITKIRIKEIQWDHSPQKPMFYESWRYCSLLGEYRIWLTPEGYLWYLYGTSASTVTPTLEQAKSAIESDYRQRLLSVIEIEDIRGMVNAVQFLLDCIEELDHSETPESFERDWHGHVEPAIARLRNYLKAD